MCAGEKSLANSLVLEPCLRPILWRVYPNQVREMEGMVGGRGGKEEGVLWGTKLRVYVWRKIIVVGRELRPVKMGLTR